MRRNDRGAESFSELYRRTHVDVLAFLLRRCANAEDAADCLAETYLVAWKKRDQMPTGDETRPWLFGVARNLMRRGNALSARTAAATSALAAELYRSGTVCLPPEPAEAGPVTAAIRQLPELDQEIITMLIWDHLAPREVAAVLGLAPNLVRVRAHRARAKLKAALAELRAGGPSQPNFNAERVATNTLSGHRPRPRRNPPHASQAD
jgi:DNA-directed RNA polymerase specialized sigma24 family protein